MTTARRASKTKAAEAASGPAASRPIIPAEYGVPKDKKGLLPWAHVSERMAQANNYWVCTVSSDGRPHATPVDGLWLDERLYFGGSPQTRRYRNLVANPAACVHLESASDVVILQGMVRVLRDVDRALALRLSEASVRKYGYGPGPDDYAQTGVLVFQTQVAFAWRQFPKDVTRWQFPDAS